MSFHVAIQKAPERIGRKGEPSAWAGASASVVTMYGTYTGPETDTMTFTVTYAGTVGTSNVITVEVSFATLSDVKSLNLGTDHGYSGGDIIGLPYGLSVSFSAASLAASDTCTVALTASNQIAGTPVVVSGDADPTDTQIPNYKRGDMHVSERTWDGREHLGKRANTGRVSLYTDYLDDENRDKLLYLKDTAAHVCVAENYNEDTLFLFHGGGEAPFIGDFATFTRAGTNATYPHARTGLWKSADTNEARITDGKAGRAIMLEAASTNLLPNSCKDTPADDWNVTGSAVLSYDTTVFGPFDPGDDYWNSDHTGGVAKVAFSAAAETCDHDNVSVSGGTAYTGSLWVKGFGSVLVRLVTGTGSPSVVQDTATVQLTPEWQRVSVTGASGGSHNSADIRIVSNEQGLCYFWGWQLEAAATVSGLIQTSGGSGSRSQDGMTFSRPLPVEAGTVSFWFYWPDTALQSLSYTLLYATGLARSERFRVTYIDSGTGSIWWYIGSGGTSLALANVGLLDAGWYHLAITWEEHASTAGTQHRKMYWNGSPLTVLSGAETNVDWEASNGTGFVMGLGDPATVEYDINGFRVEELRIDKTAMTAAEALEQYERLTEDEWLHVHRAHAGRKYRIVDINESWLHTAQPDKVLMRLELEEVDREDDSVILPDTD